MQISEGDMSYFFFNGYYSYEMGLIVEAKSIHNGPQPDFEIISVPGRNGDVLLDHGRYRNVEVSYTVSFIGTKEKAAFYSGFAEQLFSVFPNQQ